jgi:protein-L-isoaspartate O-methyltransferase
MSTPDSDYLLGSSDREHERLVRQAARIAPLTERFFREAGIGPGQRVLDVGSGVGDVALLAARLVGPTGEVVGVERDPRSVAGARRRVTEADYRNVSFTESDIAQISSNKPFDAVVGRFILQFVPPLGDLDTLSVRLSQEVVSSNSVVPWLPMVGAWSRTN